MATISERAARAEAAGYSTGAPRLSDADELGRVHLTVWQEAYQGIISADYLDELSPRAVSNPGEVV